MFLEDVIKKENMGAAFHMNNRKGDYFYITFNNKRYSWVGRWIIPELNQKLMLTEEG